MVYDLIAKIWPESDSVYDLTAIDIEYEDREEHVLAFQEGVGFGIARLDASSEEAQALREALY